MNHLVKLIDAIHILSSDSITQTALNKAEHLLKSFVDEFEILYGECNMVYNVHQLLHLAECVKKNGPLFAYSNYPMEDNIGHLVSLVKGTTDVTSQICSRYMMEKNLHICLQSSPIATAFYKQIERKLSFAVTTKIDSSLLIGNPVNKLDEREIAFIRNKLNIHSNENISEYSAILLNSRVFYETISNCLKKRTNDTFVYDSEFRRAGVIKSIITVNDHIYFLIDRKFDLLENESHYVTFLKENISQLCLLNSNLVKQKHVLIKFKNTIAMSAFPNLFEKN